MGTPNNPGRFDPKSLAPDEPYFLLRGQDYMAPALVDEWANRAEKLKVDPAKVAEARDVADRMRKYPKRKNPD